MAEDYYALLGVGRDASEEEIKRAYRRRARELHPDANGGDPEAAERFKEVATAYETLRDPERRRRYDLFGPEDARQMAGGGPDLSDLFGAGLDDLFGSFFGGGVRAGARRGPARGADIEATLELSFEEAVFGGKHEVRVRTAVPCDDCGATGARRGTTPVRCATCHGTGEVRRVRQSLLGQMVTAAPCPTCRGTGETIPTPCPTCRGEGRRLEERPYPIDVPAGVDDGTTLRYQGFGAAGLRGGPPGDLFVRLRVRPHERFRRRDHDLVLTLPVAMTQAALGADISVPTLEGEETVHLAPGTQSGLVLRLRGHGVPYVQARGRGDLLVEVVVEVPTNLSAEQEELLRKLAALRNEAVAAPEEGGLLSRLRARRH
jgi:molecular chaperone DnaJ